MFFKEFKYVKINERGLPCFILFNSIISHAKYQYDGVTSAGFVRFYYMDGKLTVSCFGRSDSLGIKSDDSDSEELYRQLINEN